MDTWDTIYVGMFYCLLTILLEFDIEVTWIQLFKGAWPDHFFDHPTYLNFLRFWYQ